ncbi:hypothetical protein ACFL5G_02170 [Candidatus Margulisiibacteriota bacterium]
MLIQSTWLPRFALWGSYPNLILILICLTGILKGPFWGGFSGGLIGITLGLLDQHFLLSFSVWLLFGVFFGLLKSNLFNNLKALSALSCLLGTWLLYFIYWTLSAFFSKEAYYLPWEIPLFNSLLNGLVAYILFPLFRSGLGLRNNE